jgi:peptide/nickel transport system ATP-binding protein
MATLEVRGLTVRFDTGRGVLTAVDGVDLQVPNGGSLGLVGESGSGKSTVARAIVGLVRCSAGQVLVEGVDVTSPRRERLRHLRSCVQMVFQDPYSSLNPRMTVAQSLVEAIRVHRKCRPADRRFEAAKLMELVDLDPSMLDRYPHQFSGGQRQRIAIARALAAEPKLIILDEVTSSLDVSVQAKVLNVLRRLQREIGISYLFISHNLSVVRYMSDVVAVMYLGRIVEYATTIELFSCPRHPYTRGLIDSIPTVSSGTSQRIRVSGEVPDPLSPPAGCRFHTRCPIGPLTHPERTICVAQDPGNAGLEGEPSAACHFPLAGGEITAGRSGGNEGKSKGVA